MRDNIKPWRRKFWLGTLLMAIVFATGWARSFEKYDVLTLTIGNTKVYFSSFDGSLGFVQMWLYVDDNYSSPPREWSWFPICTWNTGSLPTLRVTIPLFRYERVKMRAIPYWTIVAPLTLLAAYLLLNKPKSLR